MKYQQNFEHLFIGAVSKKIMWLEVFFITAIIPFFGYYVNIENIFFVGEGIPLLWFAPLLVALKYGLVCGLISALVLTMGLLSNVYFHMVEPLDNPVTYSFSLFMVAFVSGEFSDIWRHRAKRLSDATHYLTERVKEVERAYLVIKVSHDRLQKDRVKQPISLHDHSLDIRRRLHELRNDDSSVSELTALAEPLVQLFVNFAQLNVVSLHRVVDNRQVEESPLATFGSVRSLSSDEPLLLEALRTCKVVSLHEEERSVDRESAGLLVVVPIVDLEKKVWAVLAIQQMPFWAFYLNNLQTLSVIGNHMGDLLCNRARMGRDVQNSRLFIAELKRCIVDYNSYDLESVFLEFRFKSDSKVKPLRPWVMKQRPGLSVISGSRQCRDGSVLMLLPLMGECECKMYLQRLSAEMEEKFGFPTLHLAGIQVVYQAIKRTDTLKTLLQHELFLSGTVFKEISDSRSVAHQRRMIDVIDG